MPAGHAVLVMLTAFVIGTLLNADGLMRTAESLPLGSSKRAIAVGVMRPVRWVSDHLQITDPRDALDSALGKQAKNAKDPFSAFTVPSTSTTTPSNPTATTKPGVQPTTTTTTKKPAKIVAKRFHPTKARPLRVYVAGDSLSFEYGLAMGRLAAADPELEMEGAVDYHVKTGLARPDFFNWPAQLDAQMKERDPDVVVLMIGSNDDQSLASPNGKTYRDYTPGWRFEYSRRAAAVMDQVAATGRVIVWIGVPIIHDPNRSSGYRLLNQLVKTQAEARRDAYFVDSYPLFEDKDHHYQQYLPNESGQLVKMRANDGIHLERAGGDRLSHATLQLLDRVFPPRKPS
jgi:hypothetical protein